MFQGFLAIYGSEALSIKLNEGSKSYVTSYVNLVFGHFQALANGINHNTASIECWNNHKVHFNTIIESLFEKLKEEIISGLNSLKQKVPGLLKEIDHKIDQMMIDLKKTIEDDEENNIDDKKKSIHIVSYA